MVQDFSGLIPNPPISSGIIFNFMYFLRDFSGNGLLAMISVMQCAKARHLDFNVRYEFECFDELWTRGFAVFRRSRFGF